MANIDRRILSVSLEVDGELRTYSDPLYITAQGQKYANPNQGECNVSIANLRKDVVQQILTEASPFNSNPSPKRLIVRAGRQSSGTSVVYSGNIYRASISQPPDQILTIRAITGQFQKSNIISTSMGAVSQLSAISRQVGADIGVPVVFEATDKQIANYSFSGPSIKQVDRISELGNVNAYIDNETLFVKDISAPLRGRTRVVRPQDIVGMPSLTEQGLKVSFLYDPITTLGGEIDVTSIRYPAATGRWVVYKLAYHLTSRDTPFYLTAEARPI